MRRAAPLIQRTLREDVRLVVVGHPADELRVVADPYLVQEALLRICLVFFGLALLVREGKVVSYGALTAGGLVCLVVGLLGNDRAVAKIWGNR